jgi:4-amino-4-deoxy-L-arabinose transferase-like glycosyltransferase
MKKHLPIIFILILAGALRIIGINFGLPLELHPDEGKIVFPANSMAVNFIESFEGRGQTAFFNPHIFYYGGLNIYLLAFIIKTVLILAKVFPFILPSDISYAFLLGRLVTFLFSMLTVFFVYLIGSKFTTRAIGLFGALLLAFFPSHVVISHYFSGDVVAVFFTTASIYFLFSKKNIISAILLGLGVGTKYYPVTLMVLIVPYVLSQVDISLKKRLLTLLNIGFITTVVFVATNPHAVINFSEFLLDIRSQMERNSGGILGSTSPRFLYLITNKDTSSLGKFFGNSLYSDFNLMGVVFLILSVLYGFVSKNRFVKYLAFFLAFYFCFVSYPTSKEMRWLALDFPILAILVGNLALAPKNNRAKIFLASMLLSFPVYKSIASSLSFYRGDIRLIAVNWIEGNIPEGSVIYSDPILVARSPVDSDKFRVVELVHGKYNVRNAFGIDTAPKLESFVRPFYLITNSKFLEYYQSSDFRAVFPDYSQSWVWYYKNLQTKEKPLKCFNSRDGGFVPFMGSDICIYFFN